MFTVQKPITQEEAIAIASCIMVHTNQLKVVKTHWPVITFKRLKYIDLEPEDCFVLIVTVDQNQGLVLSGGGDRSFLFFDFETISFTDFVPSKYKGPQIDNLILWLMQYVTVEIERQIEQRQNENKELIKLKRKIQKPCPKGKLK